MKSPPHSIKIAYDWFPCTMVFLFSFIGIILIYIAVINIPYVSNNPHGIIFKAIEFLTSPFSPLEDIHKGLSTSQLLSNLFFNCYYVAIVMVIVETYGMLITAI